MPEYYDITVGTSGTNPAIADKVFRITVLDVSDALITLSASTVLETAPIGTVVGALAVTGATGTPVFTLTDDAGGLFAVAGSQLQVADVLDFETAASHSITVTVTGVTPLPLDATFLITVTDMAEPVIVLSANSVLEDAAIGAVVGTLSVTDATGTPTFSLTDNAVGKFSITGNQLKVADTLDYETAISHNITVRAAGTTPLPPDKQFTIQVGDVLEQSRPWNPNDKGSMLILSNGNCTAELELWAYANYWVRNTASASTGKKYFEVTINHCTSMGSMDIGIVDATASMEAVAADMTRRPPDSPITSPYVIHGADNALGAVLDINWASNQCATQADFASGGTYFYPSGAPPVGSVIGIAVDLDAHLFWAAVNNDWFHGDPVAGTGGVNWGTQAQQNMFPTQAIGYGNDPPDNEKATINIVNVYTPPTGFGPFA